MPKIKGIPFLGSYGFDGETPFRYFFLREDGKYLEQYKDDIIKCLKYDVFYHIFPDYKSGNETLDSLRPMSTNPVQLEDGRIGLVFHESVRGSRSGELVVTYKLSEDGKTLELTVFDRDTILQPVRESMDDDADLQYAVVDKIFESEIKFVKGKKLTTRDIKVYGEPRKMFGERAHSYDESVKIIKEVKSKLSYPLEDPRDLLDETQEKEKAKDKNKR